jgi:lipoprotein NlpI
MERDGIEQLKDAARELDLTKWPNTVIGLFLGSIDPGALLAQAREDKQKGKAYFYIGQWHMLENADTKAVAAFEEAARLCPITFVEHAMALPELDRLSHLRQGAEHAQASITARNARDGS